MASAARATSRDSAYFPSHCSSRGALVCDTELESHSLRITGLHAQQRIDLRFAADREPGARPRDRDSSRSSCVRARWQSAPAPVGVRALPRPSWQALRHRFRAIEIRARQRNLRKTRIAGIALKQRQSPQPFDHIEAHRSRRACIARQLVEVLLPLLRQIATKRQRPRNRLPADRTHRTARNGTARSHR